MEKKIRLSLSYSDLNPSSESAIVSKKTGNKYIPFRNEFKNSIIEVIEKVFNELQFFSNRSNKLKIEGKIIQIGFLPEFGKCVFFQKGETQRWYVDMHTNFIFDFDGDGFIDNFTYDVTGTSQVK